MASPVEQIKARLNIVDVVQSYVKLQKAGVNFKALCPFHSEKTPSFFVSPSRESWHCFGCSRGGDMFSFVMEIEGVEFPEALKILANRAGVELKPIDPKYKNERLRLLQLMEEAKKFYESELKKNKEVIDYLKERGLKGETAKAFGIGFAPNGWKNLYDFLKNKGYSEKEMEMAGMIVKDYDRFRNRIMFPLFNPSGQIVGFSGRIFDLEAGLPSGSHASLTEATEAKYINTPQTILYDKSRILYGFDKAKNEVRKKDNCILVEGQMDVLMSHQAGMRNTVAVSGTALTNDHLRIIKRLTVNIIMAFDKDKAGMGAAGRGIDLALTEGFDVKLALIPFGKDPAEAIKEDPEEWKKAVSEAKNIIEFYLDTLKGRKEIEKIVLPYIAILPSEMEKAHWVAELAKRLHINEESVWEELRKIKLDEIGFRVAPAAEIRFQKPKSRLQLLQDRLLGFILWQKETDDQELKMAIDEIIKKRKISPTYDVGSTFIFEAEIFYNGADSLKDEFKKIVLELEKEEIKSELIEITDKIRECEDKNESELEKCLNKFYKLTKKLNGKEKREN
jgi:DNA primase